MIPIGCYRKESDQFMKELILCENCSASLNSYMCKFMKNRDSLSFAWLIEIT